MNLSAQDKKYYLNIERGYQGEVIFDQLTANLESDMLVLNDLCLEFHRTVFQIDSLIISQNTIFLMEIKNYEGDYKYESEEFQKLINNYVITNPLDQLKRSKTLLSSLLKSLGIHIPIEAYVVLVNPEFTLYQAPLNASIILPTQLPRFIKKLNEIPSQLNAQHQKTAHKLISLHLAESPYTRLPDYHYDQLQKGLTCIDCDTFKITVNTKNIVCNKCGCVEVADLAVLRHIEELRLLFPDKKLTTNSVYNWCKIFPSKKKIRRILLHNYKPIGEKQHRYYV